MFTPKEVDIVIYQGATFRKAFKLETLNSSGATIPFLLDGWSARMQVREKVSSSIVLLDLTTVNGGIIFESDDSGLSVTETRIIINITAVQTNALTVKRGKYDLELVDADAHVGRLLSGNVTIVPQVTR
jgi:hypothetical protein